MTTSQRYSCEVHFSKYTSRTLLCDVEMGLKSLSVKFIEEDLQKMTNGYFKDHQTKMFSKFITKKDGRLYTKGHLDEKYYFTLIK